MRVLGIIPARGKSKGVPGKNLLNIAGKPLIQYTIDAALQSNKLTSIYLSSDDEEILRFGKKSGINIHRRSDFLATDESPVTATISKILSGLSDEFDAIMLLQPTSPLRQGQDIDRAIAMLEDNDEVNSVISVVEENEHHPARMYSYINNYLEPLMPSLEDKRRQEVPLTFFRNGSIYLTRVNAFRNNFSVMNKPIMPYIMDAQWLLNIDNPKDVLLARVLIPTWINEIKDGDS